MKKLLLIIGVFVLLCGCGNTSGVSEVDGSATTDKEEITSVTKTCTGILNGRNSTFTFHSDESGEYLVEYTWDMNYDPETMPSEEEMKEEENEFNAYEGVDTSIWVEGSTLYVKQTVKINEENIKTLAEGALIPLDEEMYENIDNLKNIEFEKSIDIMTQSGTYDCE